MNTTTRRAAGIAAALVLALAAGCGAAAPSSTAPPAQAGPPTLAQVAAEIGATGVQPIDPTLYASQEGTATWHGQPIDLAVFANDGLRDKWVAAASAFGPILVKGHDYAATTG